MAEGGNAVEAMIGMTSIVMALPAHEFDGGDAFWLVREPKGRVRYIEACGFAGRGATIAYYRGLGYDAIPPRGALAALTVPGAIGGWALALDLARALGGRLPLPDLLRDAIRFGLDGYPQSRSEANGKPFEFDMLKEAPGFPSAFLSTANSGSRHAAPRREVCQRHARSSRMKGSMIFIGARGAGNCRGYRTDGRPLTREDLSAYRAVARDSPNCICRDALTIIRRRRRKAWRRC